MSEPRVPKTAADLLSAEQAAGLTGIDIVRGMLVGRLPGAPIAQQANIRLAEVEIGRVVFEGAADFSHYNPQGAVHGGWFGMALDSAMGCAVMSRLPRGASYTTLEYKVNMIRPVFETTGPLRIIGRSIHVGRRTATADGTIEDEDGKLYATGTCTCMVLDLTQK